MTYPLTSQPRGKDGRFLTGWTHFQRWDGEQSWVRWQEAADWGPEDAGCSGILLGALAGLLLWAGLIAFVWWLT